jgi:hypothetical protein
VDENGVTPPAARRMCSSSARFIGLENRESLFG